MVQMIARSARLRPSRAPRTGGQLGRRLAIGMSHTPRTRHSYCGRIKVKPDGTNDCSISAIAAEPCSKDRRPAWKATCDRNEPHAANETLVLWPHQSEAGWYK